MKLNLSIASLALLAYSTKVKNFLNFEACFAAFDALENLDIQPIAGINDMLHVALSKSSKSSWVIKSLPVNSSNIAFASPIPGIISMPHESQSKKPIFFFNFFFKYLNRFVMHFYNYFYKIYLI